MPQQQQQQQNIIFIILTINEIANCDEPNEKDKIAKWAWIEFIFTKCTCICGLHFLFDRRVNLSIELIEKIVKSSFFAVWIVVVLVAIICYDSKIDSIMYVS